MTAYVSTTNLLKMAHQASGGRIDKAINMLDAMRREYIEAHSAIRVLRTKVQKHPGASTFSIERSGFVVVA